LITLIALLLSGCGGSNAETTDDPGEIAFDLDERGDAGAAGVRATLTYESRDKTTILVDGLDEGEPAGGGANPVWLGMGTCEDPQDVVFQLEPLRGSASETSVDIGMPALLNGEYLVAVGLTDDQPAIVACGAVPDEVPETG
jgi:hypothetical protein